NHRKVCVESILEVCNDADDLPAPDVDGDFSGFASPQEFQAVPAGTHVDTIPHRNRRCDRNGIPVQHHGGLGKTDRFKQRSLTPFQLLAVPLAAITLYRIRVSDGKPGFERSLPNLWMARNELAILLQETEERTPEECLNGCIQSRVTGQVHHSFVITVT